MIDNNFKVWQDFNIFHINKIGIYSVYLFLFCFFTKKYILSWFETQASAVILSIAAQSILLRQLLVSDRLSNQSMSASPCLVPVSLFNRYSSGPRRFLSPELDSKTFMMLSSSIPVSSPGIPLPAGALPIGLFSSILLWCPTSLSSLWFAEGSFVWLLESWSIPRLVTWDIRSFGRQVTDGKSNAIKRV